MESTPTQPSRAHLSHFKRPVGHTSDLVVELVLQEVHFSPRQFQALLQPGNLVALVQDIVRSALNRIGLDYIAIKHNCTAKKRNARISFVLCCVVVPYFTAFYRIVPHGEDVGRLSPHRISPQHTTL